MKTRELTLNNEHGLHMRVAGQIVKLARTHDCDVRVSYNGTRNANASSIMQLMTLGAVHGARVLVQADGPDEELVISELTDILSNGAGI